MLRPQINCDHFICLEGVAPEGEWTYDDALEVRNETKD